jgi:UDP-N-acetylmuramoyl-tripeptide--D-alanyl-D-alanine ligase
MISMRFEEIAATISGTLFNTSTASSSCHGVSIDSRTIKKGELFFAIRGERVDGHDYIDMAIRQGASGIVVERTWSLKEHISGKVAVISVENTHAAIIALAKHWLAMVAPHVIGITGSNGKTTTKEYTVAIARAVEPHTYGSPGNLNNLYGIPLALLRMPRNTKIAVLEMGISRPDEMKQLTDIVKPDVAVITNVGATHLEFLGSVSNVAHEKAQLILGAKTGAHAIVNADDHILMDAVRKLNRPLTTFGFTANADLKVESSEPTDDTQTQIVVEGCEFTLTISGRHQIYNLLAAFGAIRALGYDLKGKKTASIALTTAPMRGQRFIKQGIKFVADCYNANPDSVHAALLAFDDNEPGRHIVILGDMLELGALAVDYHRELGRHLAKTKFELAMLVGPLSLHTRDAAIEEGAPAHCIQHFSTAAQCAERVRTTVTAGDIVLIKGSRGIGLEAVLNIFNGSTEGEKVAR